MRIDRVKFYLPLGRAVGFPLFPLEYFRLSLLISFFFISFFPFSFCFDNLERLPPRLAITNCRSVTHSRKGHTNLGTPFSALFSSFAFNCVGHFQWETRADVASGQPTMYSNLTRLTRTWLDSLELDSWCNSHISVQDIRFEERQKDEEIYIYIYIHRDSRREKEKRTDIEWWAKYDT